MSQIVNDGIYNDDGEFRAKEAREVAQELPLYNQPASYSPHEHSPRGEFGKLMSQVKAQGAAFYNANMNNPKFDITELEKDFEQCAEGWVIHCRANGHPIDRQTALNWLWAGFEARETIEVMSYKWKRIELTEEEEQ